MGSSSAPAPDTQTPLLLAQMASQERGKVLEAQQQNESSLLHTIMQGQTGIFDMQNNLLQQYAKNVPEVQRFDPNQVSAQTAEWGAINTQRSRELDRLLNPEAAQMREQMGSQVAALTGSDAMKKYMNEWARSKGLIQQYGTGEGQGTIGRSALFDLGTEAGRQFALQGLQAQQAYLQSQPAPVGGIDPAALAAQQQAAEAQAIQNMNQYRQGVMGATGSLANALGQSQSQLQGQLSATQNQDYVNLNDWINKSMGQLQATEQANQQNVQSWEASNAGGSNALMGAGIGAGGAILGGVAIAI
jgi:hypothetical protein